LPGASAGNQYDVLVLTIDHVPGHRVTRILGEVLGLTLRLDNKYSEGIKELASGHGSTETRVGSLLATRQAAVTSMAEYASRLGANAVIGMRFDHRTISGDYNEICAYGTGVVIELLPEQ
jgi:uncharacterized protein YbjQ (UPF0145 family)